MLNIIIVRGNFMSAITSRKSLLIGFLAAVCVSAMFLLFIKNVQHTVPSHIDEISTTSSDLDPQISNVKAHQNILPAAAVQLGLGERLAVTTPEWPTVAGSPQNAAEVNDWFGARGYDFGKGSNNEYASYDIDTLEKLAQAGDVRAMKYWGKAVYGTVGGFEKAKASYINAAIHGSTDAINAVGLAMESSLYSNAKLAEEKNIAALEILAWYNAAALRGDRLPAIIGSKDFIKINKLDLSEEDQQKIQTRSKEIYDDLVQKRRALGLDEFDNSVPDSVNRYLDFLDGK